LATKVATLGDDMTPIKRKVDRNGAEKWEVDFGTVNGHRKRPLVNTEAEADVLLENYRKEVKAAGEFWARLSESDRMAATATLMQIKEEGMTVTSVWEDWKRWKKDNQQTTTTPMAYEEVVAEWERRKLAGGSPPNTSTMPSGPFSPSLGKVESGSQFTRSRAQNWSGG
jgi:hypothetical protein